MTQLILSAKIFRKIELASEYTRCSIMERTVVFEKSQFLAGLESSVTALESKTESTLAALMREEAAATVENDLNKLVSEFKKILTVAPTGSLPKLPDEIYEAIMQRVIAVEAPKFTGGADTEGSFVKTIGAYIANLLDTKTETITVGKKNYVLSNPIGTAVAAVTVTVDSKTYTFTWNNTSGASQTAKSFMESVTNFGKERFTIGLFTALLKDGMATETTEKLKDGLIRWGKTILHVKFKVKIKNPSSAEKIANEFMKDLGKMCSDLVNYSTNYIGNLISGVADLTVGSVKALDTVTKELFKDSYKTIDSVSDKYAALMEKWDALETYISENEVSPTTLATVPAYKNFVKAFNALETEIGESSSDLDYLIEAYTGYKFTDVHDETIDESHATVYGTSANDTVLVNGYNVRVYSGEGDDNVIANGGSITIIGEQGADMILLRKEGDTYDQVDTGDGNDTIFAYSGHNTINGGAGDDTILVSYTTKKAEKNKIYGGAGNDVITISAATGNTVVGEDGDDLIYVSEEASSNTISGGKGNDTINITGSNYNVITYQDGDGNDTIFGLGQDDTLYILDGNLATSTVGTDVIAQVGASSITIKDGAGKLLNVIKVPTADEISALLKEMQNNKSILGTSKNDSINNTISGANIDGGVGNDKIYNSDYNDDYEPYGNSVSMIGGAGDDLLYNAGNNVTMSGGEGNDSLYNYCGDSVTMSGGMGDDSLENFKGNNVTMDGGAGDDSLYNSWGANVSMNGGAGNDSLYNHYVNSVIMDGGAGDDSLYNYHGDSIIMGGGDGNDSLYNVGNNVTMSGGDGDDTLYNSWGANVSMSGGAGNDTLSSGGNNVLIGGGEGDDSLINNGDGVTMDGGAGADILNNSGKNVAMDGGAGNDYLSNHTGASSSVTMNGGAGNDTIHNYYGDSVMINSGSGDDIISLYSTSWDNSVKRNTISGGIGNDTIYLNSATTVGNVFVYNSGDGNDTIYNATKYDTILISCGSYSTQTSGSDLIIKVGSGAMTLIGAARTAVNIVGTLGTGDEEESATIGATINNTESGVTLNGTANKDSIMNYGGDEALIAADADEDTIFSYGDNVTIESGAGDDVIDDAGINSVIDGGAGNDRISLTGGGLSSVLTVIGGLGDDTIYGDISAHIYQYKQGDGNDTIFGYNSDDTLYVSTGSIGDASISGEDIVLKIGSGTVNLKDAKAKPVKLKNSSGTVIETILGGDEEETLPPDTDTLPAGISINGATLTASTAFTGDYISLADFASAVTKVNASALSRGISIIGTAADNSLKGGKGADTIWGAAGNDTVSLGGGADVYVYESGNDLIQDYAVADKISLASATITGSSLSGSNVVLKTSGGNITVKSGKDKAITVIDASGSETTKTYPESSSDSLPAGISVSGATLTASTAFTGNKIDLADYASTVTKVNAAVLTRGVTIVGSAAKNSLKGGKGSDTIYGGGGNDTVSLGGGADVYVYSSGNDLIQDYTAGADKIKLVSTTITGSSLSGSNVVLKTSSGNLTLKNGKGKAVTVIDASGNETTKTYPESSLPDGITVSGAVLTAGTTFTGNKIDLADYASTVTKVNASALSRGVSIVGTADDNSLKGGKGADTISGGAGNDSVSLGGGADVYVYSSGNDLIQDYTAGADKIKLASASITGASLSGSNVVLKTTGGNLTVKNGKGKSITVIDSRGTETTKVYPETSSDTLPVGLSYDSAKKVLTVGTSYGGDAIDLKNYATTTKTVDASKFTKAIKITGTNRAESLVGGSKADTLSGGKGNDTLKGNGGNDVFVYSFGDGADVIADFTAGDKISLVSGSVASASLKSSDMIFKIGSGSITVKNGKGKDISIGGSIYHDNLIYDSKKTGVTLGIGFSGTLGASDYDSKTKTINASAVTKSVNIVGNSVANSIFGGAGADYLDGGAGNDSLVGGAGDDTLTGGAGKDVFVYGSGDGNDVITDYTAGQDKIKISSGTISATSYSVSNVVFTVGTGSLTVQNGKGKKITVVDAAGKTSTKTYSGAAGSSAMWFMEGDDNFTTGVEDLSATFKDSCSESAVGDLSVRPEVVDLTAEIATAAPLFRPQEKN